MKIGFIGLGNMGAPMAANLAKAGHDVTGFDTAGIEVEGVTTASVISEATQDSDAVITMLPDGQILDKVYAQIVALGKSGALFLDCSTVDMLSARSAHAKAAEAGLLSLDAPVSGGIGGATAGTLTFMVGGSVEAYERVLPLLNIMGKRVVHCGEGGAGQAAKICNNMLLGISMIGTCEAFALGEKLGLDAERLFEVMSTSSGSCWSVNTYCPVPGVGPESPADNEYTPGFAAELMLKDLRLSQSAAEQADASTPMGHEATRLYKQFIDEQGLGRDFSAMLPVLQNRTRDNKDD